MFIDERDSSHNNSFLSIAYWLKDTTVDRYEAEDIFEPVREILFKNRCYWMKNPTYKWSNSEDKILGYSIDWRKRVQKFLLKRYALDPYCGTNSDQLEPALCYALLSYDLHFIKHITIGLILKLGFIGETSHSFFRPRIWSLIFRAYDFKFIYWILDIFEHFSKLEKYPETTRSIRDYIFLIVAQKTYTETVWTKLLKWRHRKTNWEQVFKTYFNQPNNIVIYEQMGYNVLKRG